MPLTPFLQPCQMLAAQTRGLSVVLLFASYERLIKTLCRTVLETASALRVGTKRLKPGLRLFVAANKLEGITSVSMSKVWRSHGPALIGLLDSTMCNALQVNSFPDDGSFMRTSQVSLLCELFDIGDPGPILQEVWGRLDTVVVERNSIAHGTTTADEVGRRYTIHDLRTHVDDWQLRWSEFLDHVETMGSTRDFYRMA